LPRLSIGRLMGFIALFAVELALLQHLRWEVLIFPPVTLGIISLNLAILKGLRWLPRSMAGHMSGMLCGGMIALFVLVGYHVLTVSPGRGGFIGQAISQFLADRAGARVDPSDSASAMLRLAAGSARAAEIIVLDLLGLAAIWAGGWITAHEHDVIKTAASGGDERPSPLDDRAVTPL
jgi:hypothetical protein